MRILIVEDEARIAADLQRALSEAGYVSRSPPTARTPGSRAIPRTTMRSSSISACRRSTG